MKDGTIDWIGFIRMVVRSRMRRILSKVEDDTILKLVLEFNSETSITDKNWMIVLNHILSTIQKDI